MATKEKLIQSLNEDLAAEWGTIIRYTLQAGQLSGPTGMILSDFYQSEIEDELGHAAFLTEVITDLGGEPTVTPQDFPRHKNVRDILNLDLEWEEQAMTDYRMHSELAEQLGEVELKVRLEEMAADEAEHAREIRRLLKGLPQ